MTLRVAAAVAGREDDMKYSDLISVAAAASFAVAMGAAPAAAKSGPTKVKRAKPAAAAEGQAGQAERCQGRPRNASQRDQVQSRRRGHQANQSTRSRR